MALTAHDLYEAGDLAGAIAAVTAEIRSNPLAAQRRGFLAELLAFADDLERADKQLDALSRQDPDSMVGVALFRQVIRADVARHEVHRDGRLPEFVSPPPEHVQLLLQAVAAVRSGDVAAAGQLAAAAEAARPRVPARLGDAVVDDFRDLDDLTAGVFEVLTTNGQAYWIPIEQVQRIEFRPPQRPRDLLWRRALMVVSDGPEGEVFVASAYVPPAAAGDAAPGPDDQLRLCRATAWVGDAGEPVRGIGQRTFLAGDRDVPILDLGTIAFTATHG